MSDPGTLSRDGDAVRLSGLAKTWRGPARARSTRCAGSTSRSRGRDRRTARPERRRQVDDDRHAARARATRRRHRVGVRPRAARRRQPTGSSARCCRPGALIRDLSVRELIAMMASLYPSPMDVDEVLELTGLQRDRRAANAEALRRPDAARPLRGRDRQRSRPADARRADGRDGRRGAPRSSGRACASFAARGKTVLFATHYLEEADANADRAVLMAHGRIVADGPTTEIKARVGTRTIRATLPGVRSREPRRAAGRDLSRSARRGDHPGLHGLRPGDPGAAGAPPEARDIEIDGRRARGRVPRADGEPAATVAGDRERPAR